MFICSACGERTICIETRKYETMIKRKRRCKSCGRQFSTTEIYDGVYFKMLRKMNEGKEDIDGIDFQL